MSDLEIVRRASRSRRPNWLTLAVALAGFLIADILIAAVVDVSDDAAGGVILGIIFAQVVLLAVWTALGPAKFLTRTTSGFCGAILLALTLVACIARAGSGPSQWLFLGLVVIQWGVVQVPLWVLRSRFAWRLRWPGERVNSKTRDEMQFGIRQMMVWMTMVGATMGVGRLLIPQDLDPIGRLPDQDFVILTVLLVANCLLAWPIVWSTLAPKRWVIWIVAAGFGCLGLTVAEISVFEAALHQSGEHELFWFMNSLQAGLASVALLAMRAGGFRLVRGIAAPD